MNCKLSERQSVRPVTRIDVFGAKCKLLTSSMSSSTKQVDERGGMERATGCTLSHLERFEVVVLGDVHTGHL